MARFDTLKVEDAEQVLQGVDGVEPIIADDVLIGLKIAGTIRVSATKAGGLVVSVERI